MLLVDQITVAYGRMPILHRVSLQVGAGEVVALLGRNGVGKTTSLRSIMGLVPLRSGSITFQGHHLERLPAYRLAGLGLGYVLQSPNVFPRLTVQENLRLGLVSEQYAPVHMRRILGYFPVLKERLRQPAGTLSGGEKQMLALARALLAQPVLLLLDEPTEGLMPQLARRVEDTIRDLHQHQGTSILLVEQHVEMALRVSQRLYMMEKGEIVFAGRTAEVTEHDILRHMGVSAD